MSMTMWRELTEREDGKMYTILCITSGIILTGIFAVGLYAIN